MVESSREDEEVVGCINNGSCSCITLYSQRSSVGAEGTDLVVRGTTVGMGDLALEQAKKWDLWDQGASQEFQGGCWVYG